jgi:ankyrin repeat protein
MQAAIAGCTESAVRLLDAGADPNVEDEMDNLTALDRAAEFGNQDVVKLLLQRGVDPSKDDRILLSALYGFDDTSEGQATIRMLVQNGADVFMDCWTDERPLVVAAGQGRLNTVEMFLNAPYSSSSVRQEHIWDAIRVAAEEGHSVVLKGLMEHYDPNETETETPWEWAKGYGFGESIRMLRPYFEPDSKSDYDDNESN